MSWELFDAQKQSADLTMVGGCCQMPWKGKDQPEWSFVSKWDPHNCGFKVDNDNKAVCLKLMAGLGRTDDDDDDDADDDVADDDYYYHY